MSDAATELVFEGFPKMARLSREVVITEKIDGTNAQLLITEAGLIWVGSRTRWITPADDNFGFARWVEENRDELLKLGPGRHFGEWWGQGIQRGYGRSKGEKLFSLFNTSRWKDQHTEIDTSLILPKGQNWAPRCCRVVPELYRGMFSYIAVYDALERLKEYGSVASPGFKTPEGVVVYHTAANFCFKKTIKNDEVPKALIPA